jgi:SM-20-related protein
MATVLGHDFQKQPPPDPLFEEIAAGLEERGYVVLPAGLPDDIVRCLRDRLAVLQDENFQLARVGRGSDQIKNPTVRRDHIAWIDDSQPDVDPWLQWARRLRLFLNQRLYLGLFSFESHFSCFRAGDFYRQHVDAFTGNLNRIVSLVAYFNEDWQAEQGGELVLYSPHEETELVRVLPEAGTLVLFLSEEFPHEVLPTQRDRYAVAGWFRINSSQSNHVDPPA